MNDEIKETNYMLSYIAAKIDDTLVDDYIGKINDYITNLQNTKEYLGELLHEQDEELTEEKRINQEDLKYIDELEVRIEKAIKKSVEVKDHIDKSKFDGMTKSIIIMAINEIIYVLNGRSDE